MVEARETPRRLIHGPIAVGAFDLIMRRGIGRHYRHLMKTQWRSPDELHAMQMDQLQRLFEHAWAHSPFYRERLSAVGWAPEEDVSDRLLASLPPLEKRDLQERLDDVSTVSRWPGGRPTMWSTGGSTGVATRFHVDMDTRDRRQAVQFRNAGWIGVRPGDPVAYLGGTSLGVPRSARIGHQLESRLKRQLFLPAWELDDRTLAGFADRIERFRPALLIGYSGALHAFAEYLLRDGRTVSVPVVLSTGEMLRDQWRGTIESGFDTAVYNRYGSIEVGDIAHGCAECGGMHVNDENVILHRDPETDDLLVTDLTTYATPFIRYRIGDIASVRPGPAPCGRGLSTLASLQGRATDVLHIPGGKAVSGMIFSFTPGDTPGVRQYQIWQPSIDRLQVLVVCGGETPEQQIRAELEPALPDVRLEVIGVERIPPGPNGKTPLIVRDDEYRAVQATTRTGAIS